MLEWLKRHAWKACIRQKRIPSSNLGHSAQKGDDNHCRPFFLCRNWAEEAKQGASSRKFSLIAIPIASEKVLLNPFKKEGRKC